ncbi:MAG: PhoH family protein [Planctomycetota bacterium]|jgi:phosphate starvation-inducible PhoH-like protein
MREVLELGDTEVERSVLGPADANLRALRDMLGVSASVREGRVTIDGPEAAVGRAGDVVRRLVGLVHEGVEPGPGDVERLARDGEDGGAAPSGGVPRALRVFGSNRFVKPRSPGQAQYLEALSGSDIVFCCGPAGTGKTYLAVAQACAELVSGRAGRIVLTRPAVEAGERLGFLPGDYREKVNPYLRPLYDALGDMMPERELSRYLEAGTIEVVPLAYMRGRTLNGAYAILDEAQNTTVLQMKMFLTRLGWDSRAAVVGDVTQVDLPSGEPSGMAHAMELLGGIEGLRMVALGEDDVVRHRLVKSIVRAYGRDGSGETGPDRGGG